MEILLFYGNNCKPCSDYLPIFNIIKEKYNYLEYKEYKSDEHLNEFKIFGIKGIPTTIIMDNGFELSRLVGNVKSEILDSEIEKFL